MKDQLKQSVLGCQRGVCQTGGGAEGHNRKEQDEVFDMDFLMNADTNIASDDECNYGKTEQGSCDPLTRGQSDDNTLDGAEGSPSYLVYIDGHLRGISRLRHYEIRTTSVLEGWLPVK